MLWGDKIKKHFTEMQMSEDSKCLETVGIEELLELYTNH